MNKHFQNLHRNDFLSEDLLTEEYTNNGLSDRKIAQKYGTTHNSVRRKRNLFGIPNKYTKKSNKNGSKNRKFSITKEEAQALKDEGKTTQEIASIMGCSRAVAYRRLKELDLCKTKTSTPPYLFYEVELTYIQKQLIIGSVLGDGTISTQSSYSCSHSVKYADYHKHKRDMLSSIHSGKYQIEVHKSKGKDGKNYQSIHFTTGTNKYCNYLRDIFYPNGIKVFPYVLISEYLGIEGLAYWYMDDGATHWNINNYGATCNARLLTYAFSYDQQLAIQKVLMEKFEILSNIKHDKMKGYFQAFSATQSNHLISLIIPYFIPSMMYKIDYEAYKIWRKNKELLKLQEKQGSLNTIQE
jgi:transposase